MVHVHMQDKDVVDNRRADHDVGNANDKQEIQSIQHQTPPEYPEEEELNRKTQNRKIKKK